jgi:hypothetical protein
VWKSNPLRRPTNFVARSNPPGASLFRSTSVVRLEQRARHMVGLSLNEDSDPMHIDDFQGIGTNEGTGADDRT